MRTVQNILDTKAKTFNTIHPQTLVIDALNQLSAINLSYLVVMESNEYKGIFSERDYARNVILKGHSSKNTKVEEVMSTDLPIVDVTDSVEDCMHLMNSFRTRYLLAYDRQKFRGVITIHDLLRQVITNREGVFNDSLAAELINTDEGSRVY